MASAVITNQVNALLMCVAHRPRIRCRRRVRRQQSMQQLQRANVRNFAK